MQAVIPPHQRSKVVADLLEEEVRRRERELFECALAVEQDEQLHAEMAGWDVTVGDGIETETWLRKDVQRRLGNYQQGS